MTSTRFPPLLEPYLSSPSPASLTLLTGVLGAAYNWLVVRFLAATLASGDRSQWDYEENGAEAAAVLVSFLRDRNFWKLEASRVGLDLDAHAKSGRFAFVDGLDQLFLNTNVHDERGQQVLRDPDAWSVEQEVSSTIEAVKRPSQSTQDRKVLLVVDSIDLYLAATETGTNTLHEIIGEWREHAHSTIVTVASDFPLMHSRTTPLESSHSGFVAGLALNARLVMSVRGLDTGVAKDISGVLRLAKGYGWDKAEEGRTQHGRSTVDKEEKEILYFVGMDGRVKVWERGH